MNKWDKRFMEMADLVSTWSSCYQPNRQIGAVIVKDNRIITTGYNGAPCKTLRSCIGPDYQTSHRISCDARK